MIKHKHAVFSWVIFFLVFWFVFICAHHLYQQRPLWNDEEAVFQSVQNFSAKEMFGRELMAFQVFPRAYLFVIQQFARLFDFAIWALRLPSFICMIAAFFLWLKIGRIAIKDRWQYLAFVMSWPAAGLMLYYSAELKQYSMDVLAAALFVLFLYRQEDLSRDKPKQYLLALIFLPVLGLFSHPAFFLAPLPLYNLVVLAMKQRKGWQHLAVYGLSFIVVLVLSYSLIPFNTS